LFKISLYQSKFIFANFGVYNTTKQHNFLKDKDLHILQNKITEARQILVTSHRNPDGDAIGSILSLYHFLKPLGKKINLAVPDDYPEFLKWLPGTDRVCIYENQRQKVDAVIQESDLIFALDYNDFSRTDQMESVLKASEAFKVLIDHHPYPNANQFDLLFSEVNYSSTAEIMFSILTRLAFSAAIDKDCATALYAGIMTDTGSFSYSVNRPELFETVASLVRIGVDAERVNRNIYDTYSESRLRLLGFSLSERMRVIPEYATAYIYLSQEDMKRFNYRDGDAEGLVNYGLSIKGINLSVLMKERDGVVRLSLRSKEGFSVNEFARENFDGGGHEKAAGANSYASLQDTIRKFESLLPKYRKQLNSLSE